MVALSAVTEAPSPSPPDDELTLFEGHPALVPSVGLLLLSLVTLGLALPWLWLRSRSVHYKVTTQRLLVDRGLLGKKMEQIDLYRVLDYAVERPLGQRLMGTGNLVLVSQDKTLPEIRLDGLKTDVMALYETIRKATETEKRRRGVRVIDAELS